MCLHAGRQYDCSDDQGEAATSPYRSHAVGAHGLGNNDQRVPSAKAQVNWSVELICGTGPLEFRKYFAGFRVAS